MGLLKERNLDHIQLSIFGSGHPDYEKHLQNQVKDRGLSDQVVFGGRVPREEMPALLRKYDVLLFPSTWEEPLARITQEAMASGLVVVGTLTGGTGELLVEGETGLTFPKEGPEELARQIVRLQEDPRLLRQLSKRGRKEVKERFDIRRTVSEIEQHLWAAHQGAV
jgi:glycosyltransferase involved in cell wall biosynthesis